VEDLQRTGRILTLQGDLDKARQNQQEALGVAEKIGAKAQAAQSRVGLAQLDLEEGRAIQAEQPIRDTIPVFRSEKMRDDELDAHLLLSRSLLMQAKVSDAQATLDEIRGAVTHTQNPAIRLRFAIAAARAGAANATTRRGARSDLVAAAGRAAKLGFLPLEYEARLARGEMEIQDDFAAGTHTLAALEKDAHGHGFELIARKAAALSRR
jgi:hypothetical protein